MTEFFHADAVASVNPLPVLWYLIYSLWVYLCSCMHIMSMLSSITDAVSSVSFPILFNVLTLNVAICIVCLHYSNFCFSLSAEADFSNTEARAPTSAGHAPFFTPSKSDAVWTGGLSVCHSNLLVTVFILLHRSHPYKWAAVVPWSNYLIVAVEPYDSYAKGQVRHGVEPSVSLTRSTLCSSCCFPLLSKKKKVSFFLPLLSILNFNLVNVYNYFLLKFHF